MRNSQICFSPVHRLHEVKLAQLAVSIRSENANQFFHCATIYISVGVFRDETEYIKVEIWSRSARHQTLENLLCRCHAVFPRPHASKCSREWVFIPYESYGSAKLKNGTHVDQLREGEGNMSMKCLLNGISSQLVYLLLRPLLVIRAPPTLQEVP